MPRPLLTVWLLASAMLVAPLALNAKPKRVSIAPFFWNDHNVCTAWSLKDTGRWVTAVHCLGMLKDEEAEPGEEDEEEAATPPPVYKVQDQIATVLILFIEDDLAVLTTQEGAPAVRLARRAPAMGDPVHMIGYPLGLAQPMYTMGIIANPQVVATSRWVAGLWAGIPVCQGESGSPLLNAADEVLTVFQRLPTAPCAAFAVGIPWETMVKDLKPLTK